MKVRKKIPETLLLVGINTIQQLQQLANEMKIPPLAILEDFHPSKALSTQDIKDLFEISEKVVFDEEYYLIDRVDLGFFYFTLGEFTRTKRILDKAEDLSEKLLLAKTHAELEEITQSNQILVALVKDYNEYSASAYIQLAKNVLISGDTVSNAEAFIYVGTSRAKAAGQIKDAAKILYAYGEILEKRGDKNAIGFFRQSAALLIRGNLPEIP